MLRANLDGHRQTFYDQKLAAEGLLLDASAPGILRRLDLVDSQNNQPVPFLVPGPNASASVGIALAHFKAPLQDVVRAAQAAERRAKKQLGRSAVAVTLMKRSGEILEWGCRWESGGLELLSAVQNALAENALSAKFPHRVVELLEPYLTQPTGLTRMKADAGFNGSVEEIIKQEVATALKRQKGGSWNDAIPALLIEKLSSYLRKLAEPQDKIQGVIGLMQTAAFAHRTRTESDKNSQPKGTP